MQIFNIAVYPGDGIGVDVTEQAVRVLVAVEALQGDFQLRLTREGRLDALTVRAEARPGATPEQRAEAARVIAAAVKDGIGVSVAVEVVDPETLERSVGKIKRIVDLRDRA